MSLEDNFEWCIECFIFELYGWSQIIDDGNRGTCTLQLIFNPILLVSFDYRHMILVLFYGTILYLSTSFLFRHPLFCLLNFFRFLLLAKCRSSSMFCCFFCCHSVFYIIDITSRICLVIIDKATHTSRSHSFILQVLIIFSSCITPAFHIFSFSFNKICHTPLISWDSSMFLIIQHASVVLSSENMSEYSRQSEFSSFFISIQSHIVQSIFTPLIISFKQLLLSSFYAFAFISHHSQLSLSSFHLQLND